MIALTEAEPAVRTRHVIPRGVAADAIWLQVRLMRRELRIPSGEDVADAQTLLHAWLGAQGRRDVVPYERVKGALARGLVDLRLGLDELTAWWWATRMLEQVVLRTGSTPSGDPPPPHEAEILMADAPDEVPCDWCGASTAAKTAHGEPLEVLLAGMRRVRRMVRRTAPARLRHHGLRRVGSLIRPRTTWRAAWVIAWSDAPRTPRSIPAGSSPTPPS